MILACPRCKEQGGQGAIYKGKILDLGIELRICDECEACWTNEQIMNNNSYKNLTVFLEERGLIYDDTKVEDLGYVEDK